MTYKSPSIREEFYSGVIVTFTGTGWKVFGSQLQITAPAATAAGPLQLVYTIAKSSLPDGAAPADISVLRDGVAAADCAAPGVANPDPCVSDRTVLGNGARLAYTANKRLYLRAFDQLDAVSIAANSAAIASPRTPFFSPDGQWVAIARGALVTG